MLDSARPSSLTPVKQKETAAQPLEVSVEVHVVPDSEQDDADVSKGPVGALSHMSLGTQVGSELSHPRDPPQSPSQNTEGDIGQHLNLDPAKPVAELVGQMHAQLSPTTGHASGGVRVPPLSNDNVVVVGQWIGCVGLEKLPLVQPKQVTCSGVRGLFQALQGTKIHLIQSEDDESATLTERGVSAYLARPVVGLASSTLFPSPGTGLGISVLSPSPYLREPNATAGQAPRAWRGYGY